MKSSGNTAVAVSLGRLGIENVKALALRLRENLAGNNSFDDGSVDEGLVYYSHVLLGHIVEYYRGSIDNCCDSAVDSASGAIAAEVSSKEFA